MAKIFDYVVKYYTPDETQGRTMMSDDDWNHVRGFAYWWAAEKVKEVLGFGEKAIIEPLQEDCYIIDRRFPMNGYKVTAGGKEHIWRIEPRIREQKSQAWRGL